MIVPKLIQFQQIGDSEIGFISVAQNSRNLPFHIKRVYWVYETPDTVERGNHANKTCENILVCVKGIAQVFLETQQGIKYEFVMNNPNEGLYIPPLHWRRLHMNYDVVCLSLSSTEFNENDYIRDYQEFLSYK